jgi:hypothetical protein
MVASLETWFVRLSFKLGGGNLIWAAHVEAQDQEGAVLAAGEWLKAQLGFPQKLLPHEVLEVRPDPGGARPS